MVLLLTASGEKDEELYRLVRLYGRAIEIKDVRIVTVIAGWQLLALTGFLPETDEGPYFLPRPGLL